MKFMYDALKPRYDQSKYKDVGVEHVNLNQPIIVALNEYLTDDE